MSNTTQETQVKTGNSQLNSNRPNRPSAHSTSRPKGNSKYSQKSRGRKQGKTFTKPSGPTNTYTSTCCQLQATKPAATKPAAASKDKVGLGHWHCSGRKKGCKVT